MVLVNGWRFSSTPSQAELERVIEALLKGETPFPDLPRD